MRPDLSFVGAALALQMLALPVVAQSVNGTVEEQGASAPVQGSLVVLVDSTGTFTDRALSDQAGRFALRARAPGRHRLRVQRVGFQTRQTAPFDLVDGQTVEQRVVLSSTPTAIEGLTVEGRRRCVVRPEEGENTARLWEEARKALEAASFTQASGLYRFRVRRYERHLDTESLRVKNETTGVRLVSGDRPFASLAPERLLKDGFVEQVDGGFAYHAPDADVLLSDAFLDEYCFRIVDAGPTGANQVGLSFRPTSRTGAPAIQGTLWIDRRSSELRSLEYSYTRMPPLDGPVQKLGGRIEFEALPTGAWIVRRWWIRMPSLAERVVAWRGAGGRGELSISGIKEDGGEVVEIIAADGSSVRGGRYATLTGAVHDSASNAPLAGATVSLVGTRYTAVTDSRGRFRMEGLPEGSYFVAFTHLRLRVFGVEAAPKPVSLRPGEAAALVLGVPSRARSEAVARRCREEGGEADSRGGGALAGQVRRAGTGAPVAGAEVRVTWNRYTIDSGVWEHRTSVVVSTDEDGAYLACGVPRARSVLLRVEREGRVVHESRIEELGAGDFLERDVEVPLP